MTKTFRFIGMVLMAVLVSVSFAACSDDDDDSATSAIIGKWYWDGENGEYLVFKSNGSGYEYDNEDGDTYDFYWKMTDSVLFISWDEEADWDDADSWNVVISGNKMTWTDIDEGYVDGSFTKAN